MDEARRWAAARTTALREAGMSEQVQSARAIELPEWHPMLPNPTQEERDGILACPGGSERWAEFINKRKERLRLADEVEGEPFRYGFQPPHWFRADEEQRKAAVGLYNAGGKRATKSERAGRRMMKACSKLERGKVWIFQGGEKTGIAMQQQLCWKYLPLETKALNGRGRHGVAKVNYSADGGFTEGVLVLPNRTEVYFLTYKMEPKAFQGWEIGFPMTERNRRAMAEDRELENLGAWLDEDAPLNWVETCEVRCSTRKAKVLWTFSTLDGITPAVKEVLGTPITMETRRAELLPADRVHVEGCPPGHMPFIQECGRKGWRAIFFHSDLNVFGESYGALKELFADRPEEEIKEHLYGWSKDTKGRAWPMFGELNVIDERSLPKEGTNYTFTDPAGSRNWATIWLRVAPGGSFYIYRDWPDERRFGAWAIPGDSRAGGLANPDGDAGPAQRSGGYGFARYKAMLMEAEKIVMTPTVLEKLKSFGGEALTLNEATPHPERSDSSPCPLLDRGGEGMPLTLNEATPHPALSSNEEERECPTDALEYLKTVFKDPYRAWLVWKKWNDGAELTDLQEEIFERWIDPRAGKSEQVAEKGGTCIIDELAKPSVDGGIVAPAMRFYPAPGLHIAEGIKAVDDLLDYDKSKPAMPVVNYPRLFVVRSCKQVIWTMLNYTAMGGEKGGCKDFADLVRYMGTARLRYVGGGSLKTKGGGTY